METYILQRVKKIRTKDITRQYSMFFILSLFTLWMVGVDLLTARWYETDKVQPLSPLHIESIIIISETLWGRDMIEIEKKVN